MHEQFAFVYRRRNSQQRFSSIIFLFNSRCTVLRPHLRIRFSREGSLCHKHLHLVIVLGARADPVDSIVNRVVILDHHGIPGDDDGAGRLVILIGEGVGHVPEVDDGPVELWDTGQNQS